MASNHTAGPWAVANAFMTSSGIAIYGSDANWNDLAPLCVVKPHPDAARRQSVGEANARLIAEAPAMLEALRDAMEELQAWRSKYHPIQWPDKPVVHTATRDKIRAILSRIDGAPTAQPAGDDPAVTAAANLSRAALVEAAGEALALQAPISEAGERCASCGAEEGESHGAQCETRGFAMGAAIKRGEG